MQTILAVVFALIVAVVFLAGMLALAVCASYALDNPDITKALVSMLAHREGGSWYPNGERPVIGYAVGGSVEGEQVSVNATPLDMLMALTRVKERLSATPNADVVLGIWLDKGVYYIDGSNMVADVESARSLAHDRLELAYYDVEGAESMDVEYNTTYWAITLVNGVLSIYGKTDRRVRDAIASIDVIPARAITLKELGKLVTRCKREGFPMMIDVDPDSSKSAVRLARRVSA